MAELFYRKLTGLPGGESPVVMVTTLVGVRGGLRTVEVGECLISPSRAAWRKLGGEVGVGGEFVFSK